MPEDNDTSQGTGSGDANASNSNASKDTQNSNESSDSNGQGSETTAVGADTPLDPSIMGGKYKTVGDLAKANAELQKKAFPNGEDSNTDSRQVPDADKNKSDQPQYVTKEELATIKKQEAETAKFNNACNKLGLSEAQQKALASYGELEENRSKDWPDLALELGLTTQDKLAKAKMMPKSEKGDGGQAFKVNPDDAKTQEEYDAAIDKMTPQEFEEYRQESIAREKAAQ